MSSITVSRSDRIGAWITRVAIVGILILMVNAQFPFIPHG